MYTMMKLHSQLLAVLIELPAWRALSGKISDGYTFRAKDSSQHIVSYIMLGCTLQSRTHTVAWKPIVKAPWKMKSIAAAPMPAASGVKCEYADPKSLERDGYAYGQCLSCAGLGR